MNPESLGHTPLQAVMEAEQGGDHLDLPATGVLVQDRQRPAFELRRLAHIVYVYTNCRAVSSLISRLIVWPRTLDWGSPVVCGVCGHLGDDVSTTEKATRPGCSRRSGCPSVSRNLREGSRRREKLARSPLSDPGRSNGSSASRPRPLCPIDDQLVDHVIDFANSRAFGR